MRRREEKPARAHVPRAAIIFNRERERLNKIQVFDQIICHIKHRLIEKRIYVSLLLFRKKARRNRTHTLRREANDETREESKKKITYILFSRHRSASHLCWMDVYTLFSLSLSLSSTSILTVRQRVRERSEFDVLSLLFNWFALEKVWNQSWASQCLGDWTSDTLMSPRLSSAKTSLSMTSSQTYSSSSVIIAISVIHWSSRIYLHCCLPTSQVADNADQNSFDRFTSNERTKCQQGEVLQSKPRPSWIEV